MGSFEDLLTGIRENMALFSNGLKLQFVVSRLVQISRIDIGLKKRPKKRGYHDHYTSPLLYQELKK